MSARKATADPSATRQDGSGGGSGASCRRSVRARKKAQKWLGCDIRRWPGKGCGLPSFRDETAKGTGLFVCSKSDLKKVLRGLCARARTRTSALQPARRLITLRVALLSDWKHHARRGVILCKEIDVRLCRFLERGRLHRSDSGRESLRCVFAGALLLRYLAALAAPNSSL
jgi:hypothetical protein